MTTIQQSFAYVNARFFSLLDQIQGNLVTGAPGTVSAVNILNTAGSAVVAKIVPKATFDAAIALGGVATRVTVPQLPYGMTPQRLGYNGLYKLVKQLRDDNATVESSTKDSATYTKNLTATLTTYRSGPDGLNLTARTAGTAGNLGALEVLTHAGAATISVATVATVTTVTVTLQTGVTDFTAVKTLIDNYETAHAGSIPFTVAVVNTGATLATVFTATRLSGGDTGSVVFSMVASGPPPGTANTITLAAVGAWPATSAAVAGTDVTVKLRDTGSIVATLAEIASAVTVASATVKMTALATGTTSLVAAAWGPTTLAGGTVGAGKKFIAYDVTRTLLPSKQAGLASNNVIRAVMIPKALADQIGL